MGQSRAEWRRDWGAIGRAVAQRRAEPLGRGAHLPGRVVSGLEPIDVRLCLAVGVGKAGGEQPQPAQDVVHKLADVVLAAGRRIVQLLGGDATHDTGEIIEHLGQQVGGLLRRAVHVSSVGRSVISPFR